MTLSGTDVSVTVMTDADGNAVLELPEILPTDLVLTVTKHNYIPAQQGVSVSNDMFTLSVSNASATETSGNTDGSLNPGESFNFAFDVTNNSDSTVSNISISVMTEDGGSYDYTLPSLGAGATHSCSSNACEIAADFPGMGQFDLKVEVAVGDAVFTDHRRFDVIAPYDGHVPC